MLIPREHGAYGQLLLPLATALSAGIAAAGAWAWAGAALCGFLAQEGLAVLSGRRGGRAGRERGAEARRALAGFGGASLLAGAAGWMLSGPDTRAGAVVAAALSVAAMALAGAGRERTLAGECTVALALTAWCVPVALAAGCAPAAAAAGWGVWSVTFVAATLAVRGLIARTRREAWRAASGAAVAVTALGWFALHLFARSGAIPEGLPLATAPAGLLALGLAGLPVRAQHLRRVGWTIVAAGLVTAALVARAA
jgi:hypothetical protein